MSTVSITRLRIRSWYSLPRFFWLNERAVGQLRGAAGFRGGKLLMDRSRVFWTLSLWDSEAAMQAYRDTDAHRVVMPKLVRWCDEAAVARIADAATLPGWDEAHAVLIAQGRPSKVRHPSARHATLQYPPPRPRVPERPVSPVPH